MCLAGFRRASRKVVQGLLVQKQILHRGRSSNSHAKTFDHRTAK